MAWLSSPTPSSSPGLTPLMTPGHTPSLCRCLLYALLFSRTPAVKLPNCGMNCHLSFYHFPPLPLLLKRRACYNYVSYLLSFPSLCIRLRTTSIVGCMLCISSPAINASLYYVHNILQTKKKYKKRK